MKKIFPVLLVATLLFNFNTVYSQGCLTLNAGVQMPTGDLNNLVKSGYGFSAAVGFSIPFVPLEISLTAGYNNWAYKTQSILSGTGVQTPVGNNNLYAIPVTIGPKLFIPFSVLVFKPYIGIDLGIVASSSTASGASYSTDFIYTPLLGFRLNLPPGIIAIDINIKDSNYKNSGQTFSWISINGGLAISL